jgi:hypothetical protein
VNAKSLLGGDRRIPLLAGRIFSRLAMEFHELQLTLQPRDEKLISLRGCVKYMQHA